MSARDKQIIKRIVDVLMTVLLMCLMAYQVTGELLHEWIGIAMTALLILHHILNRRWYGTLFQGKYNLYRAVTAAVNTLLLVSIVLTAVCGMSMSAFAVPFLYSLLPVSFARSIHLAMSFWSFVLMGLHLGLHIPAIAAGWNLNGLAKGLLTALWAAASVAGLRLFIRNGIPEYMFFRAQFVFFDYEKSGFLVFLENFLMLSFFALAGASAALLAKRLRKRIHMRSTK